MNTTILKKIFFRKWNIEMIHLVMSRRFPQPKVKRDAVFTLLSMTGSEELIRVCGMKSGLRTKQEIYDALKAPTPSTLITICKKKGAVCWQIFSQRSEANRGEDEEKKKGQ